MVIDRFFLGGFEFRMVSTAPLVFDPDGNTHYHSFSVPPPHVSAVHDVHTLRVVGGLTAKSGWACVAETPAWRLEARGNERRLSLASRPGHAVPATLTFQKGADSSDLCLSADDSSTEPFRHAPGRHPFRYPLDQMRLLYLLAEHHGLIMHAAGAVMGGGGVVFAGRSGAGKSTLSRLLGAEGREAVLSDDRVIVRGTKAGAWMYGTPWPGDARVAISDGAPLRALCFLRHSEEDRLIPLDPSQALHRLLEVVSVPWFDQEAFPSVLDTCETLVRGVPAFELCFRPTPAVIRLLRATLSDSF